MTENIPNPKNRLCSYNTENQKSVIRGYCRERKKIEKMIAETEAQVQEKAHDLKMQNFRDRKQSFNQTGENNENININ